MHKNEYRFPAAGPRSLSKFRATRFKASRIASFGDIPCRIFSTTVCAPQTRKFSSPRPVDPAPPTSWSSHSPPPIIGESPQRPGILKAMPLVVVTADISPFSFNAMQLMVPWRRVRRRTGRPSGASLRPRRERPSSTRAIFFFGGASVMDSQLVCPFRSRISRFHMRHARRERSVSRSSS